MIKSGWMGLFGVFLDIALVLVSFIARRITASRKAIERNEGSSDD